LGWSADPPDQPLDDLPQTQALRYVRDMLVSPGVLPERNEHLERLAPWLEHLLHDKPAHWLAYFTRLIAGAYAVFADRAAAARTPGTKQERIREHILRHAPATFRLADIRTAVPGISDQTIRLVLEQLRGEGKVRADGTGRSATWTRTENTARSE
jgi:hypothetical protein